jgi:hypothetical protein
VIRTLRIERRTSAAEAATLCLDSVLGFADLLKPD